MRIVVIVIAALVSVAALVQSRRAAGEIKKEAKAAHRRAAVTHAVHQKPGHVNVPKMPKVARH